MAKPNIADASHEEQLILLREWTAKMGVLHDAQVLQIKMWPLTLFTHAKKCEEQVNIEGKELNYVIVQTKGAAPKDIKKRYEALIDWTKWLLGKDWTVRIKLRDKLVARRGPEIE